MARVRSGERNDLGRCELAQDIAQSSTASEARASRPPRADTETLTFECHSLFALSAGVPFVLGTDIAAVRFVRQNPPRFAR